MARWKTEGGALYITDNGHCLCGRHLGVSASLSGRDISGQRVMKVTPAMVLESDKIGYRPACEECRPKVALCALCGEPGPKGCDCCSRSVCEDCSGITCNPAYPDTRVCNACSNDAT